MQVLALQAAGFQVLVPVNMVAQIVGTVPVSTSDMEFPALAGQFRWREYTVPLLKSSELMSHLAGADDDYQRIVILWPIKSTTNEDFLALTSLDSPKVIEISDQQATDELSEMDYILGAVQLEGDPGVIPDIGRICTELYQAGDNQAA
jgi:hypothetical protein